MNLNLEKKEMNIEIVGNFTPEQAQQFIQDYNNNVNSIHASDFNLVLDCRDLNVVTKELIPALQDCYKLYQSTGFNKVIFEIGTSSIVKMQLNRIAREVGLTNVEFVVV
ncbi:hypothetical protein [Lederbergia galactosidilytica]|nr:hypothetical protein [Lederbergia galactosidilytica]MBP1915118.1 galactitol-specific phosphotransferase system IIB component [Lederbergia galactosidilytica]